MGCCGQQRALLKNPPTPTRTPAPAAVARRPVLGGPGTPAATWPTTPLAASVSASTKPGGMATLRYLERSPILVEGPATGRHYNFSAGNPVQAVDRRDAAALVRTRFFRLD